MGDQLRGKTAIVTGGSRGIGRAIAIGLASHGATVVIGYLENSARAHEVVESIADMGAKAIAIRADLSHATEVSRLFDEAEQAVGPLDIVVANAADLIEKPLADCTEEDYDRIFNTNAKGVFFTLREAAQRLNDGGRIIIGAGGGVF
jgi:3-oxoacyl-[acyl-carrier protein] reductase